MGRKAKRRLSFVRRRGRSEASDTIIHDLFPDKARRRHRPHRLQSSKHAIEGLTKSMAIELGPHRVRTNSIAPTFIKTSLIEQQLPRPPRGGITSANGF